MSESELDIRVSEVMTRSVVAVAPDTSVRELLMLLEEHDISGVPVQAGNGRIVGVVSVSDVVRLGVTGHPTAEQAVAAEARRPVGDTGTDDHARRSPVEAEHVPGDYWRRAEGPLYHLPGLLPERLLTAELDRYTVRDIMTPATFSVRPQASVREAAGFLVRAGIHRALVFDEKRLAGIVTSMDIMRAIADEL